MTPSLPWKELARKLRWRWRKTKQNLNTIQSERAVLARNLAGEREYTEKLRIRATSAEARVRELERELEAYEQG